MVVSDMPKQRQLIYRMSREEGLSNNEIANKLGISKRSVENQLSIALKEIRQSILTYIIFCFICCHKLKIYFVDVSISISSCTLKKELWTTFMKS